MKPAKKKRKKFKIITALWMVGLAAGSLIPKDIMHILLPITGMDYIAHIVAYGALAFILSGYFVLRKSWFGIPLNQRRSYYLAFIGATTYGLFTELLQMASPSRGVQMIDIICNGAGIFLGIGIFAIGRMIYLRKKRNGCWARSTQTFSFGATKAAVPGLRKPPWY